MQKIVASQDLPVRVFQIAVGDEDKENMPVYCLSGQQHFFSWSLRKPYGHAEEEFAKQHGCEDPVAYVDTKRLDTLFSSTKDHIFYAKIDTEGWDFQVMQGAEQLLRNHQLNAFSFEYGLMWNPLFHLQAYNDVYTRPIAPQNIPTPNLRQVSDWLDDHDFDVFIIAKGLCIPVSGRWWQDSYEICANPDRYLKDRWCVVDMLALRKHSLERTLFLDACNRDWKWHSL